MPSRKTSPGSLNWSRSLLPRFSDQEKQECEPCCVQERRTQDKHLAGRVTWVQPSTGLIFSFLAFCLSFAGIFLGILHFLFHYNFIKENSSLPYDSSPVPSELHSLLGCPVQSPTDRWTSYFAERGLLALMERETVENTFL